MHPIIPQFCVHLKLVIPEIDIKRTPALQYCTQCYEFLREIKKCKLLSAISNTYKYKFSL